MKLRLSSGKYIVAVSGGVDSMVLLHILSRRKSLELVVAHFNHGIRTDSHLDEELVAAIAKRYGLGAVFGYGELGADTSEEEARDARYGFLNEVKQKYSAQAIITAHHQDDLIETAFLNLLRGTGRRGLSAISDSEIIRPLLQTPKSEIIQYAKQHNLEWHEDSTNRNDKYLRNYLRKILAGMSEDTKREIILNLGKLAATNKEIDKEIATLSQNIKAGNLIDRGKFIELPQTVNNELIIHWLREAGIRQYDRKLINRLNMAIKTARADTSHAARTNLRLEVGRKTAHFTTTPTPKT